MARVGLMTNMILRSSGGLLFRRSMTVNSIRYKKWSPIRASDRENPNKAKTEEQTFFPTLNRFDPTTEDRVHRFNIKCEEAIQLIKFGGVKKNLVTQYCHYLAHLSREQTDQEGYFSEKCHFLSKYILSNSDGISQIDLDNLLCDVASTSSKNCDFICDILRSTQRLQSLAPQQIELLLDACYRFDRWDTANHLLDQLPINRIQVGIVDCLTSRIISSAEKYKILQNEDEKLSLRKSIVRHLISIVEICQRNKLYFLTQHRDMFIKSLSKLGLDTNNNVTIKLSGRCTYCNEHVPIYDGSKHKALNSEIDRLLQRGSGEGLYYYTSPKEVSKFKEYLNEVVSDRRPIDYVIDGLNVAYKNTTGFIVHTVKVSDDISRTMKTHRAESKCKVLINTILRSSMLGSKILVIGKYHMQRWPDLIEFFNKYKVHYYLTTDDCEDDIYQIYAATLSHRTMIVSGDYFRDLQNFVDASFRNDLREWLDTHQIIVNRENLKGLVPTPFLKYPSVQRESNTMHIPVIDSTVAGDGEPPLPVNRKALRWICCRYGDTR